MSFFEDHISSNGYKSSSHSSSIVQTTAPGTEHQFTEMESSRSVHGGVNGRSPTLCRPISIDWPTPAKADVLSVGDRAVRLLDSVSRPSVSGLFIPNNDSNCCTPDVGPSESNPILHRTDLWFSVPGNQVLHKTARFQAAVEHRVSNLRLQIAVISWLSQYQFPHQGKSICHFAFLAVMNQVRREP